MPTAIRPRALPPDAGPPAWIGPLAAALVALAVFLAHGNSLGTPFVFDDQAAVLRNPSIRQFSTALFPPDTATGATGRPLVNLSLAVNHALGGLQPLDYHLFNVLLHAANALLVLGLLRRAFAQSALAPRLGGAGPLLAAAISLLWALHPLQTESVTCVIQRSELLGGFFYLLAFTCFFRAAAGGGRFWTIATIAACTLGPAAKELVATAPVLLLLADRALFAGSFREAWRRRGRLHLAAFAGAWLVFGVLFLATPNRGGTVGFGLGIDAWSYLLTQARALVLYLRLTLWPHPLVLDYGTPLETSLAQVWPHAALVLALLGATAWALWRRPVAGLVGAAFFVILAPSSSFIPLTTQTIAEHRMYLPLLAVLLATVPWLWLRSGRLAPWLGLGLAVALGAATEARNRDYRTAVDLWQDTAAKAPDNHRAHYNLGNALAAAGRPAEAAAAFTRAAELNPDDATIRHNRAHVLADIGRTDEAIAEYAAALRLGADSVDVHANLGAVLAKVGRLPEAAIHYQRATELQPGAADLHSSLGLLLADIGEIDGALAAHRRAIALRPDWIEARVRFGDLLLGLGRRAEALAAYEDALRLQPGSAELRRRVASLRAGGG